MKRVGSLNRDLQTISQQDLASFQISDENSVNKTVLLKD